MKSKFLRVLLAVAVTLTISALAQTGSAATPSSAGRPDAGCLRPLPPNTGTKVGAINIEAAVFGCNEGSRDLEALQKEVRAQAERTEEPERRAGRFEEAAHHHRGQAERGALAPLKKQIESKQKLFDRSVQDAQEDFGNQQQEIFGRVFCRKWLR